MSIQLKVLKVFGRYRSVFYESLQYVTVFEIRILIVLKHRRNNHLK